MWVWLYLESSRIETGADVLAPVAVVCRGSKGKDREKVGVSINCPGHFEVIHAPRDGYLRL